MTFNYDMPLYRPPSEGNNLIIQATLGCSFNHCTFCSMYKSKNYLERPQADVFADIDEAAKLWPDASRVFLADGDAMTLSMESLRAILQKLADTFPNLTRVSAYATPKNLTEKSHDELVELKTLKLNLVYFGIESGSTTVLKKIKKGASQKTMARAIKAARDAGLKISATVILGLGGQKDWREHIEGTAELINQAPPNYLSTLQLGLDPDAEDDFMSAQDEDFTLQDDEGILAEQEYFMDQLDPPSPVIFRSNHASNCLPLAGNLPKDKNKLLEIIHGAQAGSVQMRSNRQRSF